MKKVVCTLVSLSLYFSTLGSPVARAQTEDDVIKNTQADIMIVAAAGAAGAVLGLSTLSFVDRPSRHIGNIWTGAALGIIAGVLFVAYNSAQKGSEELQSSSEFNSAERYAWHLQKASPLTFEKVQFGTQFFQVSF